MGSGVKERKTLEPGHNAVFRTSKKEHPLIIEFLNAQTNITDTLRYLLEKEISENGVRNLQSIIPSVRSLLPVDGSHDKTSAVKASQSKQVVEKSDVTTTKAKSSIAEPKRFKMIRRSQEAKTQATVSSESSPKPVNMEAARSW